MQTLAVLHAKIHDQNILNYVSHYPHVLTMHFNDFLHFLVLYEVTFVSMDFTSCSFLFSKSLSPLSLFVSLLLYNHNQFIFYQYAI